MLKPKNPKADKWKVFKAKVKGKKESFKPKFDYLLSKYVNQKDILKNQSSKSIAAPSLKQDQSYQSGQTSNVIKIGSVDVIVDYRVNQKTLDHEISNKSLTSKYMQLRWCPLGLSYTQRRRLQ
jgi:hypothetical protein